MYADMKLQILVTHRAPIVAAGLFTTLQELFRETATIVRYQAGKPDDISMQPDKHNVTVIVADSSAASQLAHCTSSNRAVMPIQCIRTLIVADEYREWEVRRSMEQGNHGYLLLNCNPAELGTAVQALAQGQRYLCAEAANEIASTVIYGALTSREREVLRLIADGCCNKTIARALDITVSTVKTHVKAILEKLEATSRTEAVSVAVRRGMLGGMYRGTELRNRGIGLAGFSVIQSMEHIADMQA